MRVLRYFWEIYSLDTLDKRFTSETPNISIEFARASAREDRSNDNGLQKQSNGTSPPKWKSLEFAIYGLVILVVVPWMFYTVYDVSQRKQFAEYTPH